MSITYFVPGTEPECRVLAGLSATILDLAPGGYPSHYDAGEITPEAALEAAAGLETLPITWSGKDRDGAFYIGSGQTWHYIGWNFRDTDGARGYLRRKAAELRKVALEAQRLGAKVTFG